MDRAGIEAKLPCSLSTAIGEEFSPDAIDLSAQTEFTGVVEIEPALLSMKHVCLRISGISEPADVILNGKTISSPTSRERIYVYNVKDRLFPGYNTIVIRFAHKRHGEYSSGTRYRRFEPYDPAVESVELLAFDSATINSVNTVQRHTPNGVTIDVHMGIIGDKENVRAVATLVSPSGKIYYGGIADGRGSITVGDPLLWWPCGMGVQNLYDLSVNLYHGDVAEDVYETRIGLRALEASVVDGFPTVKIGGVPVFLKGARLMPETANSSYPTPERTEQLISTAAACGINALYASSSDRAPSAHLCELCDKYGLLLFYGLAVRVAEGDSAPADAVRREIIDGPRRIASRASTAAFCVTADGAGSAELLSESLRAYCFGAPTLLLEREPFGANLPSLPVISTIRALAKGEDTNILSMKVQKYTRGNIGTLLSALADEYPFPCGTDELSYLSQLYATETIRDAITAARIAGRGAFFADRLNDGEPLISSSLIDFFGRKKAEAYHLSRILAPLAVLHRVDGYKVEFILANDRQKDYSGTVTYTVLDRDNSELLRQELQFSAVAVGTSTVATVDLAELIEGHERDRYLVYTYGDGTRNYSETVLFTKYKYFKYKAPRIRTDISGSGRKFSVTLYSETFAHRVRLGFAEADATFENNFFDVTASAPVRVHFETAQPISAEKLSSELTVTTLYDVGRDI